MRDEAFFLFECEDYRAALPLLERVLAENPEDAETWFAVGASANRVNEGERARAALEEALKRDYRPIATRAELALALALCGELSAGIELLDELLQEVSHPGFLRSHLFVRLGDLHAVREPARALDAYRAAVEAHPVHVLAHQRLGALRAKSSDFHGAVPHLEAAARMAPDDPEAWYEFGRVLILTRSLDEARAALERAVELGYPNGDARAQLAWVYEQQGRTPLAAEQARMALGRWLPPKWRPWVRAILERNRRHL